MIVTPRVGVWIEITLRDTSKPSLWVTPRVGVWIEIIAFSRSFLSLLSLPVWECGLKSQFYRLRYPCFEVTPRVGVWIEIVK